MKYIRKYCKHIEYTQNIRKNTERIKSMCVLNVYFISHLKKKLL
jgi:hypothetical protein